MDAGPNYPLQPDNCPLEYIKATVDDSGLITVSAKGRNLEKGEDDKQFQNMDEYRRFWDFMKESLPGFESCTDPLMETTNQEAQAAIEQARLEAEKLAQEQKRKQLAQNQTDAQLDKYIDDLFKREQSTDTSYRFGQLHGMPVLGKAWSTLRDRMSWTYVLRLIILFVLVYSLCTGVPSVEMNTESKLLISTAVVIFYISIEVVYDIFKKTRQKVCGWVCGNSSESVQSPLF